MKTIFALLVMFVLSFTSNANAVTCEDLFVPVGGQSGSVREVRLEPGEQVWGTFACKACGDLKVSARPNKNKTQECPNCGTKPQPADFVPPETVERGGKLFLLEPSDLIREADGTAYLARSGRGWTCGFGTGINFQVSINCTGCGAEKPTTIAPNAAASPDVRFVNSGRAQTAEQISAASGLSITSAASLVEKAKSINVHQNGAVRKSFLRTKAGALLMSATAAGTAGFIWWGTQTYTAPGTVIQVANETALVSYKSTKGESIVIDVTAPNASVSTKDWRVGDNVTLYFRNLGGAKGVEGFDGQVLKAGEQQGR